MRYTPMPYGKAFVLAMFGIFAVAGIALVVSAVAGVDGGPPIAFVVLWVGGSMWIGYWWLFRFAIEIRIRNDREIEWMTPLRSGRFPLHDLIEIRPMRFSSNVAVFKSSDGSSVLVLAAKGLREFTEAVSSIRPDLPVRLGWQARLGERFPGRSRFERP